MSNWRTTRGLVIGALLTATAVAAACASVTDPPGGPPDLQAPLVVRISPESGAVIPRPKEVVVQFDEVVSETPRGAQSIEALVFISPKSGRPEVDWGRTRVTIKPSEGWKPNTVYSVTLSPGITDLRNNSIDSTIRVVFSTGGEIPNTRLSGAAFDWAAARPAGRALVEALAIDTATNDTTAYQALADSSGRYELRYLPAGPYLVRALLDRNSNRSLEPLEPWDTVTVTITQNSTADLYTFVHDTTGVRITDFAVLDSGRTLKISFDKPYAAEQSWVNDRVHIYRPDSSELTVTRIVTPAGRARDDSLRLRTIADSLSRARGDTSVAARARADTLARRRAADSVAAAERTPREARRLAALRGGRPVVRDTTPPPKFQRPLVYRDLFVTLDAPLPDATRLRVLVAAVRTMSGVIRTATREFTTPKAPPVDTTRARVPLPPPPDTSGTSRQ